MIIHDLKQQTPAWFDLRAGMITASRFKNLITATTLKPAASARTLENQIVAETVLRGKCQDFVGNSHTERGNILEPAARSELSYLLDKSIQEVGFVTNDQKTLGCSPDGLIGEHAGCEFKCPTATNHIAHILNPEKFYAQHRAQVQGCMAITERSRWYLMSYCEGLTPLVIGVDAEPDYQKALMEQAHISLQNIQKKLKIIESFSTFVDLSKEITWQPAEK